MSVLTGDSLHLLQTLPDNSVDAVICDPPYEIGFMGRGWDNTGIAYSVPLWEQVLRVLKPGGHLAAFGATRTYHRLACAIEDAGFEIRDSLHWLYGSGFPKSLDVSKAIDKAAGAEREVVATVKKFPSAGGANTDPGWKRPWAEGKTTMDITAPATPEAARWTGWGTALKPAHEPIVLARKKPVGTVAATVLQYGTGALNIDATRIGTDSVGWGGKGRSGDSVTAGASRGGTSGGYNYADAAARPVSGRWPSNVLLSHAPECVQTGTVVDRFGGGAKASGGFVGGYAAGDGFVRSEVQVARYACVPGCPVAILDTQSGNVKGAVSNGRRAGNGAMFDPGEQSQRPGYADAGGASRFFATLPHDAAPFAYVPKPSRAERDAGLEDRPLVRRETRTDTVAGTWVQKGPQPGRNTHVTVKPVAVMQYLVRMLCPPGGLVVDPFTGSGTTGVACVLEGAEFLGMELDPEHTVIAEARIAHARTHPEAFRKAQETTDKVLPSRAASSAPEPDTTPRSGVVVPFPTQTALFGEETAA